MIKKIIIFFLFTTITNFDTCFSAKSPKKESNSDDDKDEQPIDLSEKFKNLSVTIQNDTGFIDQNDTDFIDSLVNPVTPRKSPASQTAPKSSPTSQFLTTRKTSVGSSPRDTKKIRSLSGSDRLESERFTEGYSFDSKELGYANDFDTTQKRFAQAAHKEDKEPFFNNPENFLKVLNFQLAHKKLSFGDNYTCQTNKKFAALFWLARTAHPLGEKVIFTAKFLDTLEKNFDVPTVDTKRMQTIKDNHGNTLLHYLVLSKNLALVKQVVQLMYDINDCSELYRMAKSRTSTSLSKLLEQKISPHGCANKDGITPLRLAQNFEYKKITNYLIEQRAELTSPINSTGTTSQAKDILKEYGAKE